MKYTYNERLKIGKRIFIHEITCNDASMIYDISYYTARKYLRLYKSELKMNNVDEIQFYKVDWNTNKLVEDDNEV